MNTDRELLKLAAKAAGIEYMRGVQPHLNYPDMLTLNTTDRFWSPLNDDRDALRLAAKLRLDICRPSKDSKIVCVWVDHLGDFIEEPEGKDVCAATRRAITRAAAEIGRAMPCANKSEGDKGKHMKDDIIKLARQAGVTPGLISEKGAYFARIEHLVELARADEREACARVCESRQTPGTGSVAVLNGAANAIRARGNT